MKYFVFTLNFTAKVETLMNDAWRGPRRRFFGCVIASAGDQSKSVRSLTSSSVAISTSKRMRIPVELIAGRWRLACGGIITIITIFLMTISKIAAICAALVSERRKSNDDLRTSAISSSLPNLSASMRASSAVLGMSIAEDNFAFVCDWKVLRLRALSLTRKQVFWLRDLSDVAMVWMLRQVPPIFFVCEFQTRAKKQLHDDESMRQ